MGVSNLLLIQINNSRKGNTNPQNPLSPISTFIQKSLQRNTHFTIIFIPCCIWQKDTLVSQNLASQIRENQTDMIFCDIQSYCFAHIFRNSQCFCPSSACGLQYSLFFHQPFLYQFLCNLGCCRKTHLEGV